MKNRKLTNEQKSELLSWARTLYASDFTDKRDALVWWRKELRNAQTTGDCELLLEYTSDICVYYVREELENALNKIINN